jgi:hypothetical protein
MAPAALDRRLQVLSVQKARADRICRQGALVRPDLAVMVAPFVCRVDGRFAHHDLRTDRAHQLTPKKASR